MASPTLPAGVEIHAPVRPGYERVLTAEALAFVAALERRFGKRRRELLDKRQQIQARLDTGGLPDFLASTRSVREGDWRVGAIPPDLLDRRVEITGPVDRKMIINALNSGASIFMADFEDANTPSWRNQIEGQINLADAVRRTISYRDPATGKQYRLDEKTAVLLVRPRGWHLTEDHLRVDGAPVSGALFDFGLYVFHNARELLARGTGPYFYLPKLESHLEARLWNDVFAQAESALGLPAASIKATVLIETILAAFEMDEILYELRERAVGLNCGRWDYIFSFIKKFRNRFDFVLPDRAQVTMTTPFMRAYALELIRTCHRRGAFAMGGMAAQIPVKSDAAANEAALAQVRADKEREAGDGHDGTWVAHPGLVPVAKEVFDRLMPQPNQLARQRQDVRVTARDLLTVPAGTITEAGVRTNINVGIQYLEAWLRGNGCVPINNLMEDAATAEISRAQLWQWRRHAKAMAGGIRINDALLERLFAEEMERIRAEIGEDAWKRGKHAAARDLLWRLVVADEFVEFLTLPAYETLLRDEAVEPPEDRTDAVVPAPADTAPADAEPTAAEPAKPKRTAKAGRTQRAAATKAAASEAKAKPKRPAAKPAAGNKDGPAAKKTAPARKAGRR